MPVEHIGPVQEEGFLEAVPGVVGLEIRGHTLRLAGG